MASWASYFTGKKDPKPATHEAIISLRRHLVTLKKKEKNLNDRIKEEEKIARDNVLKNKPMALTALKNVRMLQKDLILVSGQQSQLELHINSLESASLNMETVNVMKNAAKALKAIHGNMSIEEVEDTMQSIQDQQAIAEEITMAISTGMSVGPEIDEDEMARELLQMEVDALSKTLLGAGPAPKDALLSQPTAESVETSVNGAEYDEEEELRKLQAELSMA